MYTKKTYIVALRPSNRKRKEWTIYKDGIPTLKDAESIGAAIQPNYPNMRIEVWSEFKKVLKICELK